MYRLNQCATTPHPLYTSCSQMSVSMYANYACLYNMYIQLYMYLNNLCMFMFICVYIYVGVYVCLAVWSVCLFSFFNTTTIGLLLCLYLCHPSIVKEETG